MRHLEPLILLVEDRHPLDARVVAGEALLDARPEPAVDLDDDLLVAR